MLSPLPSPPLAHTHPHTLVSSHAHVGLGLAFMDLILNGIQLAGEVVKLLGERQEGAGMGRGEGGEGEEGRGRRGGEGREEGVMEEDRIEGKEEKGRVECCSSL